MNANDPDRAAVYAAENHLIGWLDATTPEHPGITIDGEVYLPEVEPRFTDPGSAAVYVDKVMAHLRSVGASYDGWELREITVRARAGRTKATYLRETCTIALPSFEVGGRWALRATVVLHEIAHHLSGDDDHGGGWRATHLRLLEDIGSPVLAQMLHLAYEGQGLDADHPGESTLTRIAKLLRQAERTTNEAERDAFLGKAQELATRHSVALAVARAHTAKEERCEEPVVENYRIGKRGKRGLARYVRLLLNIAHANDLKCLIAHDSTAVDLHGFPSDIAVTKALYESILVQMVTDCEQFLRNHPREVEWLWDERSWDWVQRPVATITTRLAFYEAYAERIRARLQQARTETIDQVEHESAPELSGETALALRQKEVAVHDVYAASVRKNNVRGSWRGDRVSAASRAPGAATAGVRAADRASLGVERAIRQ